MSGLSTSEIYQALLQISSQFKNLFCDKCAIALKSWSDKNGIEGKILKLRTKSELGIENTSEEEDFYGEFQPWLQKKLGITTVSSWAKMIMLYCHDEKAGFEKFFNLLSEFKQRNQHLDKNEVNNISEVAATVKH